MVRRQFLNYAGLGAASTLFMAQAFAADYLADEDIIFR